MGIEMTREEIVSLVISLKEEGTSGQVSLEEVARRFDVQVLTDDLPESIAGYAAEDSNNRFVVIGNSLSPKDREWTLAHELAHVPFGIRDDKMADSFAAEFLFLKRATELHEGIKAVPQQFSSDPTGLHGLSDAALDLYLLEKHLIDEDKRLLARHLTGSVAMVGGIAIVACVVGYGISKLLDYFDPPRKTA
jgi:hypothetical protein